ncbi:hypothetical protein NX801_15270 [Streptomyces sp. LP05-1]|uniref:ATPase n=1 Tax=Streptomyces pyxinae TaxID=2970734 RepID=A0ABT2CHV5_9ACTN|nr:hypothetical protein [Streptomyces sp. LP05-1]MCS0636997.1 hypothetical protein [Streptomyces sp. LP05-1]
MTESTEPETTEEPISPSGEPERVEPDTVEHQDDADREGDGDEDAAEPLDA